MDKEASTRSPSRKCEIPLIHDIEVPGGSFYKEQGMKLKVLREKLTDFWIQNSRGMIPLLFFVSDN